MRIIYKMHPIDYATRIPKTMFVCQKHKYYSFEKFSKLEVSVDSFLALLVFPILHMHKFSCISIIESDNHIQIQNMLTKTSHFSEQFEEKLSFPDKLRLQFRMLVTVTIFQVDTRFLFHATKIKLILDALWTYNGSGTITCHQ